MLGRRGATRYKHEYPAKGLVEYVYRALWHRQVLSFNQHWTTYLPSNHIENPSQSVRTFLQDARRRRKSAVRADPIPRPCPYPFSDTPSRTENTTQEAKPDNPIYGLGGTAYVLFRSSFPFARTCLLFLRAWSTRRRLLMKVVDSSKDARLLQSLMAVRTIRKRMRHTSRPSRSCGRCQCMGSLILLYLVLLGRSFLAGG